MKTEKKELQGIDNAWGEMVAGNVAQLADLAVSRSLEQSAKSFEAFRSRIQEQANEAFSGQTLHVKINDDDIKTLSKRAGVALPRLIANSKLGLSTLLVGPAGCGKTTIAHQVAEALGLQFGSVCLTAGASETWLFGRQTPTGFVEGPFSKIYREGGVFLADEMDAADANLLLSINTALSHSEMLNPMNGDHINKHKDFIFIGAANTNGKGSNHMYTGRSRLDAATLDRMVIVLVDYDENLEKELCSDKKLFHFLKNTRQRLKSESYDEFVSTRAFVYCNRQIKAGISPNEVVKSLVANWGDAAKEVARKSFKEHYDTSDAQKNTKFYEKFVGGAPSHEWRPVQWQG